MDRYSVETELESLGNKTGGCCAVYLVQNGAFLVADALKLARKQHDGQKRKDGTAYIRHPRKVARYVNIIAHNILPGNIHLGNNFERLFNLLAAAILHDVIEDSNCDYNDVQAATNQDVADLVASLSDDKRLTGGVRHHDYCAQLMAASLEVKLVKLADLIQNAEDALLTLVDISHDQTVYTDLTADQNKALAYFRRWAKRALEVLTAIEDEKLVKYNVFCKQLLDKILTIVGDQAVVLTEQS